MGQGAARGGTINSWVKLERMGLEWERVTENIRSSARPVWKQNGLLPPPPHCCLQATLGSTELPPLEVLKQRLMVRKLVMGIRLQMGPDEMEAMAVPSGWVKVCG